MVEEKVPAVIAGNMISQEGNYKKYVARGNWKCNKSPTGAHFFSVLNRRGKGLCNYCNRDHAEVHKKVIKEKKDG